MEGCSKYCTFCVVPYTRGEEVSRPLATCCAEITQLAEKGVKRSHPARPERQRLPRRETPGRQHRRLRRPALRGGRPSTASSASATPPATRWSSPTPSSRPTPRSELVKFLHLPVQSGSDRILAAMKRNHTALEYKSRIRKLKAAVPDICISSDFIVGFPGETEKDFEQTMN